MCGVGGWVGGWVGACVRACVRVSVSRSTLLPRVPGHPTIALQQLGTFRQVFQARDAVPNRDLEKILAWSEVEASGNGSNR